MTSDEKNDITPLSGNTKLKAMPKVRRFQITLNEVSKYEELLNYLTNLKSLVYLISCKEVAPTTGHEHIHLYVCFKNNIRLSINNLCGAHVEACRGSNEENVKYIKKDGKILDEIGECPKCSNTIKDLKEIKNPDSLDWKQYNTWKKIHENDEIELDDFSKTVKVFYIQGPSGIGKTEKAKSLLKEYGYTKFSNAKFVGEFWQGVGSNRKALLYDDFRDSHLKASEFINLIDYNKHFMNIKGGCVSNDYEFIIITSIQRIEHLYSNVQGEPRLQWMRRVEIINMYDDTPINSDYDDFD